MPALLISAGGLVVSIVALAFVAIQVRLLIVQIVDAKIVFVKEQERSRKQSSLEFMAATMERRSLMQNTVPSGNDLAKVAEFLEVLQNEPPYSERRSELSRLLNYYEAVAVAVNSDVFDIGIIDRAWGSVIIRTFAGYGNYIYERREFLRQPQLYGELEQLAKSILDRRGITLEDALRPISQAMAKHRGGADFAAQNSATTPPTLSEALGDSVEQSSSL